MDTTNSSEKPQRRVEDRKPAEVIDWAAPGAPAVPLPSAATSGDAPDLQQLKALALAATPGPWTATHWNGHAPTTVMRTGTTMAIAETTGFGRDSGECAPDAAYIAAANPAVVLGLIARIEHEREVAASWQRTAEKKDRDWNEARMAFENYKCAQRAARIESTEAPALVEKKAYGPDNPPRLRKDGESVQDYRIAMGWDAPPAVAPATASGAEPRTDKDAPGYRPPCCDGAKDGSPCCSEGVCEADRELAEMGIPVISAAVSAATKPTADVQSLLATKPAAAPAVSTDFVLMPRKLSKEIRDAAGMAWATTPGYDIEAIYAAMIAASPAASTTGAAQTAELEGVVKFLMGETALEGVEFGEKHPTKAGKFWWRLNLRAAMYKASGAQQE